MIFCMDLSKYRYKIQDKIDEFILDYKMKTTKEQRQKVKRIVITSTMVMAVIIMLASNVSANELNSDTKEILYYHFKNLHYPDAQIQKCISFLNQEDIDNIVNKYNQKIASQRLPYETRADISNVTGLIVYAIIFELFRLAMMKINRGF